jgi:hypothetical protein
VLESLVGIRLRKKEADRAEKRVQEVTGWSNPLEEKIGFIEAGCQNYEVIRGEASGKERRGCASFKTCSRLIG